MKSVLFLEGRRDSYSPDKPTMTVAELISMLEGFDEDALVYLRNDRGYTYGTINYDSFEEDDLDEISD